MSDQTNALHILQSLFSNQFLGVLGTQNGGQPHTSLVAYVVNSDYTEIVFATARTTRKYENMKNDGRVAFLIDSRSHQESDFHNAAAITAYGIAKDLSGKEYQQYRQQYLSKFPFLEEFVLSPTCALMKICIEKYAIVSRFQNVVEYFPGS